MKTNKQVKSKQRKRDFGEVFTAEREVKAMCDLIPKETWDNIESTFLEPACGNGNFLVEILARKFEHCKDEKDGLKALASIVGIDIQADNCEESRNRLYNMYCAKFAQSNSVCRLMAHQILQNNIICGDSLKIQQEWIEKMGNKPVQLSLL
jgi:SAM-dependent methyltransferase